MGRKKDLARALCTVLDSLDEVKAISWDRNLSNAVTNGRNVLAGAGSNLQEEIQRRDSLIEDLKREVSTLEVAIDERDEEIDGARAEIAAINDRVTSPLQVKPAEFLELGEFIVRRAHIMAVRKTDVSGRAAIALFMKHGAAGRIDLPFDDRGARDIVLRQLRSLLAQP